MLVLAITGFQYSCWCGQHLHNAQSHFCKLKFLFPMAGSVPSLHEIGICLDWAEEENQLLAAGEGCFHKFDFLFKKHNNPI